MSNLKNEQIKMFLIQMLSVNFDSVCQDCLINFSIIHKGEKVGKLEFCHSVLGQSMRPKEVANSRVQTRDGRHLKWKHSRAEPYIKPFFDYFCFH